MTWGQIFAQDVVKEAWRSFGDEVKLIDERLYQRSFTEAMSMLSEYKVLGCRPKEMACIHSLLAGRAHFCCTEITNHVAPCRVSL